MVNNQTNNNILRVLWLHFSFLELKLKGSTCLAPVPISVQMWSWLLCPHVSALPILKTPCANNMLIVNFFLINDFNYYIVEPWLLMGELWKLVLLFLGGIGTLPGFFHLSRTCHFISWNYLYHVNRRQITFWYPYIIKPNDVLSVSALCTYLPLQRKVQA